MLLTHNRSERNSVKARNNYPATLINNMWELNISSELRKTISNSENWESFSVEFKYAFFVSFARWLRHMCCNALNEFSMWGAVCAIEPSTIIEIQLEAQVVLCVGNDTLPTHLIEICLQYIENTVKKYAWYMTIWLTISHFTSGCSSHLTMTSSSFISNDYSPDIFNSLCSNLPKKGKVYSPNAHHRKSNTVWLSILEGIL